MALLALGVGMLSAAVATGQLVGWLLGLLIVLAGGLGGIAAVVAVQVRYRQGPVAAELSTQIRREQHCAPGAGPDCSVPPAPLSRTTS